jgi:4-alpha-glucanotransferase
MKKIIFLFAVHNHQPVGNFDYVMDHAYDRCYKPFLELLAQHPAIKISIHNSGPLLNWLEDNAVEYLDLLRSLVQRGQVEVLSGGYYEPILSIIPREDAINQIKKMNQYTLDRLGTKPKGLWLAERIWEPQMASLLADAGIEYTLIDDSHFSYSGLKDEDMFGYYITEDNGKLLKVFPINKTMRYSIPFRPVDETIKFLREAAVDWEGKAVTLGDDGEKFGIWPHTYKWVYTDGYLKKLFKALEKNSDWIELMPISEYIDRYGPADRIYLPTASYEEMMEWSLPAKTQHEYRKMVSELSSSDNYREMKPFLRGGFWRNFLVKYPESNLMHKKMLFVSSRANENGSQTGLDSLWQGQCNCPYWHGLFGGLYLPHLRHANYSKLIEAENAIDHLEDKRTEIATMKKLDYNMDGRDELLLSTNKLNCYIDPNYGGSIFEIDYRPKCFNITNNLARHEEAYHEKIRESVGAGESDQPKSAHDIVTCKEKDLDKYLVYDWHNRFCFLDHFFQRQITAEKFRTNNYREVGDFVNQPYHVTKASTSNGLHEVNLKRDGGLFWADKRSSLTLEKRFTVRDNEISAKISIRNKEPEKMHIFYGCELNFSLLAGKAPDRYYLIDEEKPKRSHLASSGPCIAQKIALVDEYSGFRINIQSDKELTILRMPIETVSQSESGFERIYQSSCVLFTLKKNLGPQGSAGFALKLTVENLN